MSDRGSSNLKEVTLTLGATIALKQYNNIKVSVSETRTRRPDQSEDEFYEEASDKVAKRFVLLIEGAESTIEGF